MVGLSHLSSLHSPSPLSVLHLATDSDKEMVGGSGTSSVQTFCFLLFASQIFCSVPAAVVRGGGGVTDRHLIDLWVVD